MSGKKADLGSPIIMWIGVLIISLVVIVWYIDTIEPLYSDSNIIEDDLRNINQIVDVACNSHAYEKKYNPRMNSGNITINGTHNCMATEEISSCINLSCETEVFKENLSDISNLNIKVEPGEKVRIEGERFDR